MASKDVPPRRQIRRFDIFAEWNRLKALERKHMGEDDARAYGLAVAKIVARGHFTDSSPSSCAS